MSITIKDLVQNKDVLFKLVQNKWDSPKKSYEVYKFYMELESQVNFFGREKAKLAKLWGEVNENGTYNIKEENKEQFLNELQKILEITPELPELNITMEDVVNTKYTDDKETWLTPVEMYRIEEFLKKLDNSCSSENKE